MSRKLTHALFTLILYSKGREIALYFIYIYIYPGAADGKGPVFLGSWVHGARRPPGWLSGGCGRRGSALTSPAECPRSARGHWTDRPPGGGAVFGCTAFLSTTHKIMSKWSAVREIWGSFEHWRGNPQPWRKRDPSWWLVGTTPRLAALGRNGPRWRRDTS